MMVGDLERERMNLRSKKNWVKAEDRIGDDIFTNTAILGTTERIFDVLPRNARLRNWDSERSKLLSLSLKCLLKQLQRLDGATGFDRTEMLKPPLITLSSVLKKITFKITEGRNRLQE